MCSGSEAGSYLRLKDSCTTQLKAHGPSMTCNESNEEEEDYPGQRRGGSGARAVAPTSSQDGLVLAYLATIGP